MGCTGGIAQPSDCSLTHVLPAYWRKLLVAVLLESVGSVLFGADTLRAGSLPRAGAWLLIVSIPIFVIAIVASTAIGNSPWTNWFFVVGEVVCGSGCIVLGSRCGLTEASRSRQCR